MHISSLLLFNYIYEHDIVTILLLILDLQLTVVNNINKFFLLVFCKWLGMCEGKDNKRTINSVGTNLMNVMTSYY